MTLRVELEPTRYPAFAPNQTRMIAATLRAAPAGHVFVAKGIPPDSAKTAAYRCARAIGMRVAVSVKDGHAAIAVISRTDAPTGRAGFDLMPFEAGRSEYVRPKWKWERVRQALAAMKPGNAFKVDRATLAYDSAPAKARRTQYLRKLVAATGKPIKVQVERGTGDVLIVYPKPERRRG